MESAIENKAARDEPPGVQRGANHRHSPAEPAMTASESEALTACVELCDFLQGGLSGAQEALVQTLKLQQAMMEVISGYILSPQGSGQPGQTPEDLADLVGAMQSDDLMRQRQENLTQALAAMSESVKEVRALAESAAGTLASEGRLGRDWSTELLKMLTLDEMRQVFEQNLETALRD